MKSLLTCAFLTVILTLVSCGAVELTAPADYLVLEEPTRPYNYEAVSAEGCKIVVTEEENQNEATLKFWADAARKINEINKGYIFGEDGDFKTKLGDGKYILFNHQKDGIDYIYIVGVVRTDDTVYYLESAGKKEHLEPQKADIIKSFASLE